MTHGIRRWLTENAAVLESLAHDIHGYAEVADEETRSAARLAEFLRSHGFSVETGVAGLPTAFRAVWGDGKPVLGFLGEYDALPGMNQEPVPFRDGNDDAPGHGCGHNLLGVGSAAAAVALRYAVEQAGLSGTVVFYGCPAEEILKGKIEMAGAGCFAELDAALAWHPSTAYSQGAVSYLAMDSVHFYFHGTSSHAAAAPDMGRSALDAAELMNVGVNYLREHVPDGVRMHYAYLDGPGKPNIVPANASLWYFIRARERATVDAVTERVIAVARGAAMMTGTEVRHAFQTRGYGTLVNHALCALFDEVMRGLPLPEYTDRELAFAAALARNVDSPQADGTIVGAVPPYDGTTALMAGSTDISDVSQITPVGYLKTVCAPRGVPLHSWQFTACADSAIGYKGMVYAATVLAESGYRLISCPLLLGRVREEFTTTATGYAPLAD